MPNAEFRLATQQVVADVWVLTLSGDCGDPAGVALDRQVATLHGNRGPTHAIVDLGGATVVRKPLCDHLVESARAARERGISMTVVTDVSSVRKRLGDAEQEGALRLESLLATGIRDALLASRE
jgi:hypothetical protein